MRFLDNCMSNESFKTNIVKDIQVILNTYQILLCIYLHVCIIFYVYKVSVNLVVSFF